MIFYEFNDVYIFRLNGFENKSIRYNMLKKITLNSQADSVTHNDVKQGQTFHQTATDRQTYVR